MIQEHKTRAEIIRDKVKISLALDIQGKEIEKLLAETGVVIQGADWSKVFPYWLVAVVDNKVIGCIQVMPAIPVGWLEALTVSPSVSFKFRAIAIRKLLAQGLATLKLGGCQLACATVDINNKKMKNVLDKMNCIKVCDAEILVKNLA